MYCIYHSRDLDGFTSAAIVKRKYPEATLIGYDYGEPIPEIPVGEPVIMVDVSMSMPDMFEMCARAKGQMTWIDHHATATEDYMKYVSISKRSEYDLSLVVLRTGTSACELTWEYLFPEESMPEAVLLLGEYDTWRREDELRWVLKILPFQYGMRAICNSPETFPDDLFEPSAYLAQVVENGRAIISYNNKTNEVLCRRISFDASLLGYSLICINGAGLSSDSFKSVYDESRHDVMFSFAYTGKKWICSLYTTKPDVDCGMIAKSLGGGGHKAAAGFECDDAPMLLGKK